MNRPEPWENPDPERFHFEAVEDDFVTWRAVPIGHRQPCRFGATRGRRACGEMSVAALLRPRRTVNNRHGSSWWHYCGDHLYGRWIEDGKVMTWRLVPNDAEPSG